MSASLLLALTAVNYMTGSTAIAFEVSVQHGVLDAKAHLSQISTPDALDASPDPTDHGVVQTVAGQVAVDIGAQVPLLLLSGLLVLALGSYVGSFMGMGNDIFAIMGFMTCSSMMLVVNKLAITVLPYPGTVLALQLLSCAIGVRICGSLGFIEVAPLSMDRICSFGATPFAFLATLLANIKILEYANVETFIMVRNATPLATSVLDWFFLGRELPDRMSVFMLSLALVGSVGYVECDASFQVTAYSWAFIWLIIFLFDQVYIKHIISTVPMSSWTRVYYNNALAGAAALVYVFIHEGAFTPLIDGWVGSSFTGALVVGGSCAMGTAMSYFAFLARDALSATSFTVVGNVCKVLSIMVNVLLWDRHATRSGLQWLSVVIFSSAIYKQAPLRKEHQDEALPLVLGTK